MLLLDLTMIREGTTGRVLQEMVDTPGGVDLMTVDLCTTACENAGYSLAGIEYGQECCELMTTL